jgi:DNA-directed RNA polymerase specialized sigma24 family protein
VSGDEEFRAFVASSQRTPLRAALALTLDAGLAEDLVQTAYLRTYARWDRLRDQEPAPPTSPRAGGTRSGS